MENMNPNPQTILQQPLNWNTSQRRKVVIVFLLVVATIYIASFNANWCVGRDSGLYLSLARNLVRGDGYTIAGSPHTCVPPGYPALLAGEMSIFGQSFLVFDIFQMAIGLAVAFISYLLFCQLVNRDWALILVAAMAVSQEIVQRSGEVLSDMPFMLLVVAALWLYARGLRAENPKRGFWELASVLLVASCWVRMAGLPFVVGAAAGLALSVKRGVRIRGYLNTAVILIGLAGSLAFFYYFAKNNAEPDAASYLASMKHNNGGFSAFDLLWKLFDSFWRISQDFSRLILSLEMPFLLSLFVFVVPVVVAMVRRIVQGDRLGPLAVGGYVFGLILLGYARTRYLMPAMPLLFLYMLEGIAWFLSTISKKPLVVKRVVAVLLIVIVGFNLVSVGRLVIEKRRSDYVVSQQKGLWRDVPAVVEFLKQNTPDDAAIIADQCVGYLADLPCPFLSKKISPSGEKIQEIFNDWNVRYVVIDTENIDYRNLLKKALLDYLEPKMEPVFCEGATRVYAVGAD